MKSIFFMVALFAIAAVSLQAQDNFKIDSKKSIVRWKGNKVVGGHWGDVDLKSGNLAIEKGQLVGGSFVIDLNTITALDLKEDEGKSKLEGHLKSDDFFAVSKFPSASFSITKVEKIANAKRGSNNYNITGDLTIRDKTHSISFPAIIETKGTWTSAKAEFSIDRTKWDIKFNSGNFFKDLGDKMIKDEIEFVISLSANK